MNRALWLATWMGATAAWSADPLPQGDISLSVGSQRVLPAEGVTRVAVGNPAVAEVKALGNQLLVTGMGEGRTSLLFWSGSGVRRSLRIAVSRQDPQELSDELRKLLRELKGVSVRVAGGRVYLDGRVFTPEDFERVERALALYPMVKSFVTGAPDARTRAAKRLNGILEAAGLAGASARAVGELLFVEGAVENAQELKKLELLLKASGEAVENLAAVGLRRMISSEVSFVEIRRSSRDRVGIKYPTDVVGRLGGVANWQKVLFGGPATGAAGVEASASADASVGFQLNHGAARLLAQPQLVCASGEKAEFLAGGQVPIPLITNNQLAVQYKEYGIILKIRPTADRAGFIQTEIEAEASEVDSSVAVSFGGSAQIPGFRTRRVNTNVTVRHGETIVLSGVFSYDEQKSVSKLPGLGHLPLLGELFKSRGFDFGYRELLIFVTPRIVTPGSERMAASVNDIKQRYRQAQGEVRFRIFD